MKALKAPVSLCYGSTVRRVGPWKRTDDIIYQPESLVCASQGALSRIGDGRPFFDLASSLNEGSQALKPPSPGSRGPQEEGPSRCSGSAPRRARSQTVGPSLAPPADAAQPGSDRHCRNRDTRGKPYNTGKASRPPPGWSQVASLGRGGGAQ
ncbi:hypothetical protein NDU88_005798 [Pleurodeles waltl]|uniref:Uncharacterized protein n=1 Tax=Pleurodeles waltl TaxID=8319 RepID=A0AAV7UN48_PLEWA|nr:hypothetical protein NDU88_005798 [Pleurodeles waltl]